jgi:hypothetical protein
MLSADEFEALAAHKKAEQRVLQVRRAVVKHCAPHAELS